MSHPEGRIGKSNFERPFYEFIEGIKGECEKSMILDNKQD